MGLHAVAATRRSVSDLRTFSEHSQLIIPHTNDIRSIAMLQLDGAEAMGMKATDVLKHVDFEGMTKTQKAALKKKLGVHKKHLQKSMDAVDKALEKL